MELMQLRYFMEVATSQHMTRSSEKLHIAQPALSQSIHRLERELGVKLFEQKGRGIVLTELGRYLRDSLAPILRRLDRFPEELARMAKLDRDTVRIDVLAASALVTEAIVAYKNRAEVNFSVFQNNSDVGDIRVSTRVPHRGREEGPFEFAVAEEIFLAVPREKYGKTVWLKDLEGEGFICLFGSEQFRAICDRYCRHAGFRPNVIFESDNPAAVRNAIAAGMGIGFWPQFTWGNAENELVKLVSIADLPFAREIVISYNPSRADNGNAKAFFEYLKAYFLGRKSESLSERRTGTDRDRLARDIFGR